MAEATKKSKAPKTRVTYQLDGAYTPDLSKAERLSKPPFIRPLSLPAGGIITAIILGIATSMVGTGKKQRENKSLSLKCVNSNMKAFPPEMELSFPMNTVMEGALGDDLDKHKNGTITIKVLEPRKSPNFGKEYFNCEVFMGAAKAAK